MRISDWSSDVCSSDLIEPRLLRAEAVGGGMRQIMIDLGRAKQRLGRNAPPVEADPAQLLPLDDGGFHPKLRRENSGHISARAKAENDKVVSNSHAGAPLGWVSLQQDRKSVGAGKSG